MSSTLKYRLVTNWPASMSEDFTFDPTEDRNAHYDLCVEIMGCIADEKHPENFRITEETIYEYDVVRPQEPSLPRMPFPTEALEGDTEFMDLCHRYIFTDKARFARSYSTRSVHLAVTESFTLEGEELATMAELAKNNRAEAKFRFILASYGVEDDEVAIRTAADEAAAARFAAGRPLVDGGVLDSEEVFLGGGGDSVIPGRSGRAGKSGASAGSKQATRLGGPWFPSADRTGEQYDFEIDDEFEENRMVALMENASKKSQKGKEKGKKPKKETAEKASKKDKRDKKRKKAKKDKGAKSGKGDKKNRKDPKDKRATKAKNNKKNKGKGKKK